MSTPKTITLEELYKMRGDIAIAALEELASAAKVAQVVLDNLAMMDSHYKLKSDLESSGINEIVKTIRAKFPEATEGKPDAEVIAMFSQGGAGAAP